MGRLSRLSGIARGFSEGYGLSRGIMRDVALSDAGNVKPEEQTAFTQDQAQRLEAAASAKGADGNPLYNVQANEGGTYSVTPTAGGETWALAPVKKFKMGALERDTPFTPEQITAEKWRRQADVHTQYGDAKQAAELQGLAKNKEEEGTTKQIRDGATAGLTKDPNMRDEEKQFLMTKGMYETAVKLSMPDIAQGYYNTMKQGREELLDNGWNRAERVRRATVSDENPSGSISGFVDVQNKFVANGMIISGFKDNADGKGGAWLKIKDELTGKENETLVPREKLGNYLMQLRDIKKVEAIEQARAKTIFDEGVKTREALNKPMSVGKNDTVVIPATGQQFAPKGGGIGQFDVKEANPVLDDARKMILERTSNFDQATGKWNWSPEAVAKAQTAERLFMKNPSIPPAMLADIADKGATGTAIVEIGGKQQRVPAVSHNGRTYILGGNDAGQPSPTAPQQSAIVPAAPDTTGLGTRSVRGKIAPVGLQRDMQVSPDVQAVRDVQAGRQLVAEAGGVQRAAQDLAELDAALKNPRLDGTQRGILQSHRNRLAAGIAAFQ